VNPWTTLIEPPLPGRWYGAKRLHILRDEAPASAPEEQPVFQPWALLKPGQRPAPGPWWPLLGSGEMEVKR
jgi:hypothetical protein